MLLKLKSLIQNWILKIITIKVTKPNVINVKLKENKKKVEIENRNRISINDDIKLLDDGSAVAIVSLNNTKFKIEIPKVVTKRCDNFKGSHLRCEYVGKFPENPYQKTIRLLKYSKDNALIENFNHNVFFQLSFYEKGIGSAKILKIQQA